MGLNETDENKTRTGKTDDIFAQVFSDGTEQNMSGGGDDAGMTDSANEGPGIQEQTSAGQEVKNVSREDTGRTQGANAADALEQSLATLSDSLQNSEADPNTNAQNMTVPDGVLTGAVSNGAENSLQKSGEQPADEGIPDGKKKSGCGFFALAAFPFLFLLVLGIVLVVVRFTTGESDSLFSLMKGNSGNPVDTYISEAGREVRGVFAATAYNINYPSTQSLSEKNLKKELDEIVDACLANSLNAIYFQVSPNSDALYHSEILPLSSVVTGTEGKEFPGGFDPLSYLCEKAHAHGIEVHAWINPVRITTQILTFDRLSADNPAKKNPGWTIDYDGTLYYNLGVPEARSLQASICAELVENFEIDGIIFDDYFYPYPVENISFDDAEEYTVYGKEFSSIEDFRRNCTTELIKACYQAIKEKNPECAFGIAPFGIWRNNDGSNGGSNTRGFQSYESLYCDTLAFIKGGYVDYIAPQIYWQSSSEAASYTVLCDWWNRAVEGTDVQLLISHAAYKAAEWNSQSEFSDQVEYARKLKHYTGSIFYGLAALENNDCEICTQLSSVYEAEYVYTDFYSTGEDVTVQSCTTDGTTVTVSGKSDVFYSLYYGDMVIGQKKDGSFSFTAACPSDSKIILKQNGKEFIFEVKES